jgi:hypothetical protein
MLSATVGTLEIAQHIVRNPDDRGGETCILPQFIGCKLLGNVRFSCGKTTSF